MCLWVLYCGFQGTASIAWKGCLEVDPIVVATATPLYFLQGKEPKAKWGHETNGTTLSPSPPVSTTLLPVGPALY